MRDGEKEARRSVLGAAHGACALMFALLAIWNASRDCVGWFILTLIGAGAATFCAITILSSPAPSPADKEG